MKKYLVGGEVRDSLLNKPIRDRDWVVIGSTPQKMIDAGFKQVGSEFPVFLHPETNEEYALARTERKVGCKHTDFEFDFSPNVTLEDDLRRRDFTINAFVEDEYGYTRDYFGGFDDLKNKILRAINPETFIEDPLRVLRGARFAAQLDFNIDPFTMELFNDMVSKGMLEHLTPERIWNETKKALSTGYNSRKYFEVLAKCNALKYISYDLYKLTNTPENPVYHPSRWTFEHTMIALDRARLFRDDVKFAVLVHDLGKSNTPQEILPKHIDHDIRGLDLIDSMCDKLKIPNSYRDLAKLFCKYHMRLGKFNDMNLKKQYDVIRDISDNFKNTDQYISIAECFYADYFGENEQTIYNQNLEYGRINHRMNNIYYTMNDITLKDLPEKTQERLKKYKGEEFGKQYRDEMINYLREKLNERNLNE